MTINDNISTRVCKTGHGPLILFCHSRCDLDLYPIDPKINREHLLSMTYVFIKFEKAGPNQTLVIDRTWLYSTDGWTDRRTGAKQYAPIFERGHNNNN